MKANNNIADERLAILNEILANIDAELKECESNINASMLVYCNCIVATEDAEFQVGVENGTNKAIVLVGNCTTPVWLSEKAARNLLYEQGFKASNGNGELKFKIWGWKEFYRQRRDNLLKGRKMMIDAYNKVNA